MMDTMIKNHFLSKHKNKINHPEIQGLYIDNLYYLLNLENFCLMNKKELICSYYSIKDDENFENILSVAAQKCYE